MNLSYPRLLSGLFSRSFWDSGEKFTRTPSDFKASRKIIENNFPKPEPILLVNFKVPDTDYEEPEEMGLLDLPFSTCVFEAPDQSIYNLPGKKDGPVWLRGEQDVMAILVHEITPGRYLFVNYTAQSNISLSSDPTQDGYKITYSVVEKICEFINSKSSKLGSVKQSERYKHPGNGLTKIKKAVVVTNSKVANTGMIGTRDIQWSHCWLVRGHWRITKGVGKNRNGDYCIKGMTWVTSHAKGEGLELVNKTRVVI